jgi:TPR repeat protein
MRSRPKQHSPRLSRRSHLGIVAVACALCGACHRRHPSADQPDPSASAISLPLGIALGSCSDLAACERECDAGSADRCRRLAASYSFGQGGVAKDEARAASLYEQACAMKDPSACMFAGQMSEYARGVIKDDAKAARLYTRACDLQWPPGCYNLAIMFERGTGVPADEQKAADLYQAACDGGAVTSCEKAEDMKMLPLLRLLDGGAPK